MDSTLDNYLDSIYRHLKPLSTSEKVDIIKEIKCQIIEMEKDEGLSPQQIIDKLGDPKDMARAYLSDLIYENSRFNRQKFMAIFAFYGLTGLSGAIIIPFLGILAPSLKFFGIVTPILGIVKLIGFIFHFDIPFVLITIGAVELHPILAFLTSFLIGIGMYKLGCKLWEVLKTYIHNVSKRKNELFND